MRLALVAILVFAAPLAAQDPQPDTKKPDAKLTLDRQLVIQLLDRLDHRAFGAREQATGALLAMGPAVIPHLERYLQRSPSPSLEGQRRAESVIGQIALAQHWKSFRPGKRVGNLQALMRCDRPVYLLGEPINLSILVTNVGAKSVPCLALTTLDAKLPSGSRTSPAATGRLLLKEIRVIGGGMRGRWSSRSSGGKPSKPISLAVGGEIKRRFKLRDFTPSWGNSSDLRPGVYEIQLTLFTKQQLKLPADLATNAVRFQIATKR